MEQLLEKKFAVALEDKKLALLRHQQELAELERLADGSKRIPIKWYRKITQKNARKEFSQASILDLYRKRAKSRRGDVSPSEIELTSIQIWRGINLPSQFSSPNARFRGYLHNLKLDGLLIQEEGKWKLTKKSLKMQDWN